MKTNNIKAEETSEKKGNGTWFVLFALAHVCCCGIPLLILSGISISTFFTSRPVIAIGLALLGVIGFIWYLKRGCPTCPRNEGRCIGGKWETPFNQSKVKNEQEKETE